MIEPGLSTTVDVVWALLSNYCELLVKHLISICIWTFKSKTLAMGYLAECTCRGNDNKKSILDINPDINLSWY